MERRKDIKLPGLFLFPLTAEHVFLHIALIVFIIAVGHHQFGGVFRPDINAIGLFAGALQGRSVDAIGSAVVLPGDIVLSQGIHGTLYPGLHLAGHSFFDGKSGRAVRGHAGVDKQFSVVADLIIHLLPLAVDDHERRLRFHSNLVHIHSNQFLPLHIGGIAHRQVHGQSRHHQKTANSHSVLILYRQDEQIPPVDEF